MNQAKITPPPARRTGRAYFWVPRQWQVDFQYLVEGFEGLLGIRTLDSNLGLMEVMISPGAESHFPAIAQALLAAYPDIRPACPGPPLGLSRETCPSEACGWPPSAAR